MLQVPKAALLLNNARSVTVLLQVCQRLLCMLYGIVQDHYFGGVVLQQMNDDSLSDAAAGPSNYLDLHGSVQVS